MTRADVCMHCRLTSSVRGSAAHTATRRRAYRGGTPQARVAVRTVRSGPSGSATRTGLHAQGRVAVPPTLPLDVERTKTVRSRPSGSAAHTGPHAQGRVAVRLTLPLDVERTEAVRPGPSGSANGTLGPEWQCRPHCHLVVNVRGSATHTATRRRTYQNGTLRAEWQCGFGRPTG